MSYKNILVVSDNEHIVSDFINLLESDPKYTDGREFRFACSPQSPQMVGQVICAYTVESIDIKLDYTDIIERHDLVISAHCKQLFPEALVSSIKCVNIHPGFNPYNRGWYPQVFSILNGLPLGATIHEIDKKLDHGRIINQRKVPVNAWDTSMDAYNRVQAAELELLRESLEDILNDDYTATKPKSKGNLNLKKDFEALREIKLDEETTYGQAIDRFRALTHNGFKNAYFFDSKTGEKVFVSISLEPENE